MAEDDVYNSYVMLDYQAEKQRADQEKVKADHNEILLQKSEQRAEQKKMKIAKKLKELGISLDELMGGDI